MTACPQCSKPRPAFNFARIALDPADLLHSKIVSVTFRVRCACGHEWKFVKDTPDPARLEDNPWKGDS